MIYIISNSNYLKIGKSRNPTKRLKSLQTGSSKRLTLEACFRTIDDHIAEKKLHKYFAEKKSHGEWFVVTVAEVIQAITQLDLLYRNEKQIEMLFDKPFTRDEGFIHWLKSIDYHDVSWWELFEDGRPLRKKQLAFDYMEAMYAKYQKGESGEIESDSENCRVVLSQLRASLKDF